MKQSLCKISDNINFDSMVKSLCTVAKTGLSRYYPDTGDMLPYSATIKYCGDFESTGFSIRYAAISQIGIARWIKFHPEDKGSLPDLCPKIIDRFSGITNIGDLALALWAVVASKADAPGLFTNALSDIWQHQAELCNAVELGWIVQAATLALKEHEDLESVLSPVFNDARDRLIALFRPQQSLFKRHNRPGFGEVVNRRIACFADQVYPILALSTYGQYFKDKKCIEMAAETANQICRFQGPLGQWWWHYDTIEGKVCEEYPVFSVHQDAMAPMAIMASDRLNGQNHHREIELGLNWLFAHNELTYQMLLNGDGFVYRDIEKREPVKLSRNLRALLCVAGLRRLHKLAGNSFIGFRVNHECRPYHLGWILYAWADYRLNG